MSEVLAHTSQRHPRGFARTYGANVEEVLFTPGEATAVLLSDGRSGAGTCLGCGTPPCMQKEEAEFSLPGVLAAFPGDPSTDVCPTRAVRWDNSQKVAVISQSDCIGCGLCVARCPYGAISLADGLIARVESSDPDSLSRSVAEERAHATPLRSGQIASLDAPAAANLPASVASIQDARVALLIRNLFGELGLNVRVRRRGDTNMRVDLVGVISDQPIVGEIELTSGVLESPRALLEDVAILHARYDFPVNSIVPLSVVLSFPNVRSEYYQVIADIEAILNVRCRSVSIGALTSLLWTNRKFEMDGDDYCVRDGSIDLSKSLRIDKQLLREPYPGAFKPSK